MRNLEDKVRERNALEDEARLLLLFADAAEQSASGRIVQYRYCQSTVVARRACAESSIEPRRNEFLASLIGQRVTLRFGGED